MPPIRKTIGVVTPDGVPPGDVGVGAGVRIGLAVFAVVGPPAAPAAGLGVIELAGGVVGVGEGGIEVGVSVFVGNNVGVGVNELVV